MCSTDVYCSKQTGSSSTKKPSPIISSFLDGQKKTVDPAKICGLENVVKTETQQTFVNGLLGFITLGIYTRWKRIDAHYSGTWVAHRVDALSLLINILLGSFSCFCIVVSLSLRSEIIPDSAVSASRGGCVSRRRQWWLHALTDRLLWCTADDDQRQHRRASFPALASANSFVYFASSAATSRWRICMSVIAAFASFSSLAFLSRWAL